MTQIRVHLRNFPDRALQHLNLGDLAAEVKVQQFEPILDPAPFEFAHESHQFGNRQAELRALAARLEPAPRTARRELHAHRESRRLIRAIGERHQLFEFGVLLDDRKHALTKRLRRQDQRQHDVILDAVAQQQPVVADVRQRRDQLRLRATLETQAIRFAGVEHFLDDLVHLIDLDRIDRLIGAAVTGIGNRRLESLHQPPHSGAQNVLKTHEHWRRYITLCRGFDDFENVDREVFVEQRAHGRMTRVVDEIEPVAPRTHRIQFFGARDRPGPCVDPTCSVVDGHGAFPRLLRAT